MRTLVDRQGLAGQVELDSAGTHGYHIGKPPDPRARAAAAKRGYDLSALRGRQVCPDDFVRFDYILAMDRDNLDLLLEACPIEYQAKVELFLNYAKRFSEDEVPDPYYGGPEGFDRVLDLVEDAAGGLIERLRQ